MSASCTPELQPLDLSYNYVFKSGVATLFASWLSQLAQQQLLKGVTPDKLSFDLRLKTVAFPLLKGLQDTEKISESKQSAMKDGWDRTKGHPL